MLMVRRNILHFTWKYFAGNLLFGETMTEKLKLYLYFQHIGKTANWKYCISDIFSLEFPLPEIANIRREFLGLVDWKGVDLVAFCANQILQRCCANQILQRLAKKIWIRETIGQNCVNFDVSLIVVLMERVTVIVWVWTI